MRTRPAPGIAWILGSMMIWIAAVAGAESLKVGDPAPELRPFKWLKGAPVERFEKNHVYVIDFWATWCVPCKKAMPHLTALAEQYAGKATFIGMNILETQGATAASVETYVKKMGSDMGYAVAMDDIQTDAAANQWYRAASLGSMPSAIIVDGNGTIAWVNTVLPLERFDQAIARTIDGTLDLAAAKSGQEQMKEQLAAYKHERELTQTLGLAFIRKDYAAVLREADTLIARDPQNERLVFWTKLAALLQTNEANGLVYARLKGADASFLQKLDKVGGKYWVAIGNNIASQDGLSRKTYEYAVECFTRVDAQLLNDTLGWMGLARAYDRLGESEKAIEAQMNAIGAAQKANRDPDLIQRLTDELAAYRR